MQRIKTTVHIYLIIRAFKGVQNVKKYLEQFAAALAFIAFIVFVGFSESLVEILVHFFEGVI